MKFTKPQNAGLRRIIASGFDLAVFKFEANLNLNLKGFLLISDEELQKLLDFFSLKYHRALKRSGDDAALDALKRNLARKEIFVNTSKETLVATIPLLLEDCKGIIIPRAYKLVNALGDSADYENELMLSWIIERVKGYWTSVWFDKTFKTRTGFRNQKVPYFLFLILIKNKIKNQVRTMQMQFSKRPDTSMLKPELTEYHQYVSSTPSIEESMEYSSVFDYCFSLLDQSPVDPNIIVEIKNGYRNFSDMSVEARRMLKLYLYKAGYKSPKVIQFVSNLPLAIRQKHKIDESELDYDVDKYL